LHDFWHTSRVGQNQTHLHVNMELTVHKDIHDVYVLFWPTLHTSNRQETLKSYNEAHLHMLDSIPELPRRFCVGYHQAQIVKALACVVSSSPVDLGRRDTFYLSENMMPIRYNIARFCTLLQRLHA